jgi:hypothetical protein
MASVYVHYCVDPFGLADIHFSGERDAPNRSIKDKNAFNAAVTGMGQIPSGKKRWDATAKVWHIDSEYWQKIMLFYVNGAPLFEMVPYPTPAMFEQFMLDAPKPAPGTFRNQPDNVAAQGFFNNFNQVIEKVAVAKSDKDMLAELLALPSYDAIPRDKATAQKLYKQAAMRWHPDRNNGDGSRMASLNQLWGAYVKPTL